jgi:hypothetical protein
MPGLALSLCTLKRRLKPTPRSLGRDARSDRPKDQIGFIGKAHVAESVENRLSDRVQRNGARISILGLQQLNLPTLEIHLFPDQAVLLTHPHPGEDRQPEVGGTVKAGPRWRRAARIRSRSCGSSRPGEGLGPEEVD